MTTRVPLRLLLDQNFPNPPHGLQWEMLDKSVTLHHFSHLFPEHARRSTPDWMVHLLAREAGMTAVVSSDKDQLDNDEVLIALDRTRMSVITWRSGEQDTVVLYGQLLAYMPQIVRALGNRHRTIILLPNPRLTPRQHVFVVRDFLGEKRVRDGISYPERRGASLRIIRTELRRRGFEGLERHLQE